MVCDNCNAYFYGVGTAKENICISSCKFSRPKKPKPRKPRPPGRPLTEEQKQKIGDAMRGVNKGRKLPPRSREHIKKIRESCIKHVEKIKLNGAPLYPRVGAYEPTILDILEDYIGYTVLRQHKVSGYFLDGYCPALNLVIEVNEKHHFNEQLNYTEKHSIRKHNIIQDMRCNWLDIDIKPPKTLQKTETFK